MKKVFAVIAVVAMVSVASSWAASIIVTNVSLNVPITLKGKLAPSKTAVTEADLSTNAVSFLELTIVDTNATVSTAHAATTNITFGSILLATNTGTIVTNSTGATTNWVGTGTATATLSNGWSVAVVGATNIITVGLTTNIVTSVTNATAGSLTFVGTWGTNTAATVTTYTNIGGTATCILSNGWRISIEPVSTNVISGVTSNIVDAIGHEVNVTNAVTYLAEEAFVDLTPTSTKGDKFVDVFDGTSGSASNAVIVLTGTLKTKGTTTSLSGKIQGVWADGVSAVTGTIKGKTE